MIILQFCILVVPYTLQSAAAAATAAEKRAACDGASSASASGGDAGTPRERKAPRATGRLSAPAPEEHMQGLRGETPSVTLAPSAFTAAFAGDNRIVPFSSLLFPDPDGPPPMVSAHSMYLPGFLLFIGTRLVTHALSRVHSAFASCERSFQKKEKCFYFPVLSDLSAVSVCVTPPLPSTPR